MADSIHSRISIINFFRRGWPVILAIGFFAYNAFELNFIQDDAYISYRYVANFLNGDGLVYNIGEQVEGITNQGWVVWMILWGTLGLDYIFWSQVIGFLLGMGIIALSFLLARRLFKNSIWLTAPVALLVGINPSLAYWSPAGLETAVFGFLVIVSLILYLKRSWLLIASISLAVWMRPEGAMLAGLFILMELIIYRRWPMFSLASAAVAFVVSIPFVIFKLSYYGSILPNPFFAKTSFDLPQLINGLEYTGRFMAHYGFYGLGIIVPALFWRKLSSELKSVWVFVIAYIAYIVFIGGDVLKVHRFFFPLFGPAAALVVLSVTLILQQLRLKSRGWAPVVFVVPLLVMTYLLPRDFIKTYNRIEKNFTHKMQFYGRELKKADESNFTVATPTIGIIGYELIGHDLIDMLGLTDSTIARYSEEPIAGMETTWKEQKHNSRYLLERAPDYIIFSTGAKPSAPAERALLLYPQFLQSYRSIAWFYEIRGKPGQGRMVAAFKKVRPIQGEVAPTYPVEYVEQYNLGLGAMSRGDHKQALSNYDRALRVSPRQYNPDLLYQKASSHFKLGQEDKGWPLLHYILEQDSMVYDAHKDLYSYTVLTGDGEQAAIHRRWLHELVPWYLPRLDSQINRKLQLLKADTVRQSR
ncbi:hypothetical protein JYU03_00195 [bacterium AH-315-F03]|nr:hypothetical protein [bacterium AH-315-F03]